MGYLLDFVAFIGGMVMLTLISGAAYAGAAFLLHKFWGPPEEGHAFDFRTDDNRALQEFVLQCVIAGGIVAATVFILGFGLTHVTYFFKSHRGTLGLILLVIYYPAAFAGAFFMFRQEPKRLAILAGVPFLLFLILLWPAFLKLFF